jgi:RimJ/RimL family protein N-acetyltransferase
MSMISFRPLEEDDFELLLVWLQRPHVKEWWNDGDDTLEKVRDHYTRNPDETRRFILLYPDDKSPSGYFQYYIRPDGVIGIDQFLADVESLNRGLGSASVSQFLRMILEKHSPIRIVTDPSPDNLRAIRCYEKVGFKFYETVEEDSGKLAYMMELVTDV